MIRGETVMSHRTYKDVSASRSPVVARDKTIRALSGHLRWVLRRGAAATLKSRDDDCDLIHMGGEQDGYSCWPDQADMLLATVQIFNVGA